MVKLLRILPVLLPVFIFLIPTHPVFAHEQYVLTKQQLAMGMADHSLNVWSALQSPENLKIGLLVTVGILILVTAYFFFQYSVLGVALGKFLEKLDPLAHLLLRVAVAGSLLAGAYFQAFLGPEIPLSSLPFSIFLIPAMVVCGLALLLGIFSRGASVIAFLILLGATAVYGSYMATYLNYYGEFLALMVFGSYAFSVDKRLFGVLPFVKKFKNAELFLIRTTYGVSVLYPAITIKLLHPEVIVEIVNQYHINQIHWLFPSDPLLISLGTGLAQILVGLMIIIGFETRLASFTTFFLYLLSVLFFKEAVWPHYILLALAFYLVINNGGEWGLDSWIGKLRMNKKSRKKGG